TASRTLTIDLAPKTAPIGFAGSYFQGTVSEGGTKRGDLSMGWVSSFFRKATLEIDTLIGAATPTAVGADDFSSVFAAAGWDLTVIRDQNNVAVPAGVTATNCWSSADLHALMLTVRNVSTNLDQEWHMHLLMVPAKMGCGRGVMYDTINVP